MSPAATEGSAAASASSGRIQAEPARGDGEVGGGQALPAAGLAGEGGFAGEAVGDGFVGFGAGLVGHVGSLGGGERGEQVGGCVGGGHAAGEGGIGHEIDQEGGGVALEFVGQGEAVPDDVGAEFEGEGPGGGVEGPDGGVADDGVGLAGVGFEGGAQVGLYFGQDLGFVGFAGLAGLEGGKVAALGVEPLNGALLAVLRAALAGVQGGGAQLVALHGGLAGHGGSPVVGGPARAAGSRRRSAGLLEFDVFGVDGGAEVLDDVGVVAALVVF